MIYNEKDILKGSERACGINLKDARELFDSRKDSTLNVVRYIVNIVNEYINDIQRGYHNANYYGVGVHEKIVSILEANPKVLEDKLIKRQVESCFLNLLCHDIEEFNVYNSPLILSFMKKYLNVGNAFLKREPQQSLIYEAARRGIEKSFQSEANATGVTYILDFLKNYLNLDNKKVFANPEINDRFIKLGIGAIEFSLSCGCTEEAIKTIDILERYTDFNKNELKTCFNKFRFKKAMAKGYIETLESCVPQIFDDLVIFAKEYIGINEENMSNFLIKSKVKEINERNKAKNNFLL